jgi:hypothetical protein
MLARVIGFRVGASEQGITNGEQNLDLGNGLEFVSITAGKIHFEPILKNAASRFNSS